LHYSRSLFTLFWSTQAATVAERRKELRAARLRALEAKASGKDLFVRAQGLLSFPPSSFSFPPPFSFFPPFSLPKVSFRSLLLPSSLPTSLPFPPVKGLFWKKYLPRVTGRFSALFPARPSTRLQCFRALAGARCVCRAAGGCG
jgi:hypothetical protein